MSWPSGMRMLPVALRAGRPILDVSAVILPDHNGLT